MSSSSVALNAVPQQLRDPLLAEFENIVQNFLEQRWLPSELSGGRFSEIVYTILDGHAKGTYASAPIKPTNFLVACRALENNASEPRSFQILIPRLLPALYEIRNNRSVGHVGGDVDPNHMDAVAVVSMCSWIMGELVRVLHGLTTVEAQKVVDALVEIRLPLVWTDGTVKRILDTSLKLREQILLFAATATPSIPSKEILQFTEYGNKQYFYKLLWELHTNRFVEFNEADDSVRILPPGSKYVQKIILANHMEI